MHSTFQALNSYKVLLNLFAIKGHIKQSLHASWLNHLAHRHLMLRAGETPNGKPENLKWSLFVLKFFWKTSHFVISGMQADNESHF